MFGSKFFGLGQSFTGDGGDIGPAATTHIIISQVRHRIGGGAVQRSAHVVIASACGVKRQILDLVIRDQQLGAQPLWVQRDPGLAQQGQLAGQIGGVDCDFSDQCPDSCGT